MTPGKSTQEQALEKVRWLKEGGAKGVVPRHISVDGGISAAGRDGGTARMASEAGANVLVSGSFVFGHPGGCAEGGQGHARGRGCPLLILDFRKGSIMHG